MGIKERRIRKKENILNRSSATKDFGNSIKDVLTLIKTVQKTNRITNIFLAGHTPWRLLFC